MEKIKREVEKEASDVEEFKETKMGELLDYNVKLSDLQNQYSSVFEGTGEKRRTLENMDERKIEKRLEKTEYSVNTLTESDAGSIVTQTLGRRLPLFFC